MNRKSVHLNWKSFCFQLFLAGKLKNQDVKLEEADLFVKEIWVDGGRILKRLRPAPQGSAHRIRKRSNHVTLIVDSLKDNAGAEVTVEEKETKE